MPPGIVSSIYRVWLPAKLHIGTENEWLDAVLKYIKANAEYMKAFLQEKLPKVKMTEPEGTYLVWLNFREYGLRRGELDQFITKKAGLWLDSGSMFGKVGEGFQRINIACPRKLLAEALQKLVSAFDSEI